jgi:hypothetical protein
MMLDMKHLLRILLVVIGSGLVSRPACAQTPYVLFIDSVVGLPDTVINGQEVTFFLTISLNSPLFYQGNVFVELEYGGSLHAVDSSMSANSFLGPNAPNTVQASHRFSTDDDLNIGDNVVVVWPRIGDGTNPPQEVPDPYETIITLIEPSGVGENQRKKTPLFHPNPASNTIQVVNDLINSNFSTKVFDAQGRIVISSVNSTRIDVSALPIGVYLIQVQSNVGALLSDRLLISR